MPSLDYSAYLNPLVRQASLLGQSGFADYFNKYPDLQAEWRRLTATGAAAARGWYSPEQYAGWHWQTYGQAEGRALGAETATTTAQVTPPLSDTAQLTTDEQAKTRVPQRSDAEIQEIARLARLGEQNRGGRRATMLTGGGGITGAFQAGRPQLRQSGIMR